MNITPPAAYSTTDKAKYTAMGDAALSALVDPVPNPDPRAKHDLPPLLAQLHHQCADVDGNTGEASGAKSLANEKGMVDWPAIELMREIRKEVAKLVEARIGADAGAGQLANWLRIAWELDKKVGDVESMKETALAMRGWVHAIDGIFNPRPSVSIQGPCGECGVAEILGREDGMTDEQIEEWEADGLEIPETKMLIRSALVLKGDVLECRHCEMKVIGIEEIRAHEARRAGSTVLALNAEKKRLEELNAVAVEVEAARWAA